MIWLLHSPNRQGQVADREWQGRHPRSRARATTHQPPVCKTLARLSKPQKRSCSPNSNSETVSFVCASAWIHQAGSASSTLLQPIYAHPSDLGLGYFSESLPCVMRMKRSGLLGLFLLAFSACLEQALGYALCLST